MVALTRLMPAAFGAGVVVRGRRAEKPVEAVTVGDATVARDVNRVGEEVRRSGDADARRALGEVEAMSLAEPAATEDDARIVFLFDAVERKMEQDWCSGCPS